MFPNQKPVIPLSSFWPFNFICMYNICLAHNSKQAIKTFLIIVASGFLFTYVSKSKIYILRHAYT